MKSLFFKVASTTLVVALMFNLVGVIATPHVSAATQPNLIVNPSVESGSSAGPSNWFQNTWGTNTAKFSYVTGGVDGTHAVRIDITSYGSGDAKWYPTDAGVMPGKVYLFTDQYMATAPSELVVRYTLTNGSFQYVDVSGGNLPATSTWKATSARVTIPTNVKSITIFHLIAAVGSLTTDAYSLTEATTLPTPPPQDPSNLIKNNSVEVADITGLPLGWNTSSWGSNVPQFTYLTGGHTGQKAVKVQITQYSSGDAKWYFDEVPVTADSSLTFSDFFMANVPGEVIIQYHTDTDTFNYSYLGNTSASASWQQFFGTFTVPQHTVSVTVFHLIAQTGYLIVDDASLSKTTSPTNNTNAFSEGLVSLNFDDGYKITFTNALPILNKAGLKSTQYVISGTLNGSYGPSYVTAADVLTMQAQGHEIGAHTQTHPHLPQLTNSQIIDEITGSRGDLLSIGVKNVDTFAYPFGEYNDFVVQTVKNAGFSGARTTDEGFNLKNTNKFLLKFQSVEVNTTVAQVKQWIDSAVANHTWLILIFHQIDHSNDQYSFYPENLQQIVDYITQKKVHVVTTSQGIKLMNP